MLFSFIATLVVSLILLKLYVIFSYQLGIVDIPDARSSHIQPTPSGSGVVLFLTIILILFFSDLKEYQSYILSLFAVFFIFMLGVYDDFKCLSPLYKILIITLSATLLYLDGFAVTNIGTYFGYTIELFWLSIPFTIMAVVGFTNALNLIDGLDGLAACISIIIFSALWYIGYQNNDSLLLLSPIIIAALIGFLIFNWNPAKVFMGDAGSLTLGFVIAMLSIKALYYVTPVVMLYLLALPLIDTLIIIVRRKRSNRPIFAPDKHHIHHIFRDFFNDSVRKTVIAIALVQIIYTLFGFMAVTIMPQEVALLLFILSLISWYILLNKLSKSYSQ